MNDTRVYDFFFDMFLKKKDFIRKKKGRKKNYLSDTLNL